MAAKKTDSATIEIIKVEIERITVALVGTTPFICNRVSEKAKHELLLPGGRKNEAQRAQSLKHDPVAEFRASPYTLAEENAPTLLAFLAVAFKKAMMTAALDIPGAKKAQIGRLVQPDTGGLWAHGQRVPLYGVPQIFMSVTRSADIKRTPDIRTRAIVPEWAVLLDLSYPKSMIKRGSTLNLLDAGGRYSGVGDWRAEKGSGNYGSFRIAQMDDPELTKIIKAGNRAAQIAAMNEPTFYDDDSADLFAWYQSEAKRRELKVS